jgi:ATP-binding cassette, subfamily C, bacterial exporter for protease/lipase
MSACLELLKLAPILFMLTIYDRVLNSGSGVTLLSLIILIVGVYIFWSSIDWLRTRLLIRISLRVDWDLAADVFDASFRRQVGRRPVNVAKMMGDLVALRQFFTGKAILALMDAPFAVVFIIVGFIFHPLLALFIFGAVATMVVAAYISQRVSEPVLKAASEENSEAQRVAGEGLKNAEATYALGMLPAMRRRWYERHRKFLEYSMNASEASGLMGGMSAFLARSLPSMQIALGAWLAMQGEITHGMVIAASMLIGLAVAPIRDLLSNGSSIVEARTAYARLNLLISEDRQNQGQMALPPPTGKLDVMAVIGVPPGSNRAVVQDISFSVSPGQAVAVIGPSAAGKTSLSRLLMGIWTPARGSVRLDGVEISDWNHDELGPHIGYVPQDVALFEGTVAENIARLGEVDPDKVVDAARLIGMHESILSFPNGYDTVLGTGAFALSGGQRQRIAIARSLYGTPRFIVMDEPNANLDDVGESMLISAITTLKEQGVTFIITTHRPRIIGVTDNLLVLRAGRQVGYGPAHEMVAALRNLQAVGDQNVPASVPFAANVTSIADVKHG